MYRVCHSIFVRRIAAFALVVLIEGGVGEIEDVHKSASRGGKVTELMICIIFSVSCGSNQEDHHREPRQEKIWFLLDTLFVWLAGVYGYA